MVVRGCKVPQQWLKAVYHAFCPRVVMSLTGPSEVEEPTSRTLVGNLGGSRVSRLGQAECDVLQSLTQSRRTGIRRLRLMGIVELLHIWVWEVEAGTILGKTAPLSEVLTFRGAKDQVLAEAGEILVVIKARS